MMEEREIILYQIMECLVEQYGYSILRFNGQKQDLWLTNQKHSQFPIVRLNAKATSSLIFETDYVHKVQTFLKQFIKSDDPILIINTNAESEAFQEGVFTQVLLNEKNENIMLFNKFPALREAIHEVKDKDQEMKRINKRLQDLQAKRMREQYKKANQLPRFTAGIIGALVMVFVLTMLLSQYLGGWDDSTAWITSLIISGAYYKPFILGANEYWRLFTGGLLHLNLMHLLVNMLALYSLGGLIEKVYKKWQYIAILVVSIIVGNLVTLVATDTVLSVGVSGGLYGLLAATIVYTFENGSIRLPQVRNSIMRVILINLLISLMPGISMSALIGGFISGGILGFMLIKTAKWKAYKLHVGICFVLLLSSLVYLGYRDGKIEQVSPQLDQQVVTNLRKLGLGGYATHLENRLDHLYDQ